MVEKKRVQTFFLLRKYTSHLPKAAVSLPGLSELILPASALTLWTC